MLIHGQNVSSSDDFDPITNKVNGKNKLPKLYNLYFSRAWGDLLRQAETWENATFSNKSGNLNKNIATDYLFTCEIVL